MFSDFVQFLDDVGSILDFAEDAPNTLLQELRQRTQEAEEENYRRQLNDLRQQHRALVQSLENEERWTPPTEEEIGYYEYRAMLRSVRDSQDLLQATRSKEPRDSVNWKKEGF